jgi:hypothetical protein
MPPALIFPILTVPHTTTSSSCKFGAKYTLVLAWFSYFFGVCSVRAVFTSDDIRQHAATTLSHPGPPVSFHPCLARIFEDPDANGVVTYFSGQHRALTVKSEEGISPKSRFLSTLGVLTCINVFVHNGKNTGFGSHIPIGNVLFAALQQFMTDGKKGRRSDAINILQQDLTQVIEDVFVDDADVKVWLVGGHKYDEQHGNHALENYFPGGGKKMATISHHIEEAIRRTRFFRRKGSKSSIDKRFLNVFSGKDIQSANGLREKKWCCHLNLGAPRGLVALKRCPNGHVRKVSP